jgi:D-alanyl-D-alanine carboxypeptidase/D-alanyl-D-alanine-endopeptidase (penicillin-binding protein 4)
LTSSGPGPNNVGVRRLVLVLALLAVLVAPGALASSSASKQTLARKLQKSLAVGGLSGSRTGALAADLHTGEILYAQNAGRPLAPASVEKLPVTYAALTALGPTFRFHTEVLGVGKRSGKVWRGDLVLRGYGDPTLTDRDLGSLASEVRSRGIRRVQGRILGDESFFDSRRTAPGWKSYYYMNECPPLSALVADRAVWEGRPTRWPAAAAAAGLKRALRRAGVRVHGRAVKAKRSSNGAGTVLASGQSGLLRKVLRFMAQESDNFTAEMVVKQLGALHGGGGTTAFGSGVVKELLTSEGIALGGVRIADGSGLSRYDRLTARTLVELLQAAWLSPSLHKPFLDALAVAGRSGTLSQRLTGRLTRGRVFAKTGTTLVSSSLAGFVKGRYAFAIINNGSPINSWAARVAQDRFVTVLARAA